MRLTPVLQAAFAIATLGGAARGEDGVEKRDCSFERAGRPTIQSRCTVRTATLAGVTDVTIRMDDGKALHLEGPLAGEKRYRLQGGFAHLGAAGQAGAACYERDDGGMTLCLGRLADR